MDYVYEPNASISDRVYQFVTPVFYYFFKSKTKEKINGIGDCSLVLLASFTKDIKDTNKKELADDLNFSLDYLQEILDYLVSEDILIKSPVNTKHSQAECEADWEIEGEKFRESSIKLYNKVFTVIPPERKNKIYM